ncbi:unnamed protein product, partial [Ectocarpus sp. 13 AM-2016]
ETSRFHFRQHTEEQCALHNSPEARDDPTLWDVTPEGQETFLWSSSRAESNNSWLSEGGLQNWRRYQMTWYSLRSGGPKASSPHTTNDKQPD